MSEVSVDEASSKVHTLKTHTAPFQAVWQRLKTFEFRKNDRGFSVGDRLHLREFDEKTQSYGDRSVIGVITYVLEGPQFGVPSGFVVMSCEWKRMIQGEEIVWRNHR